MQLVVASILRLWWRLSWALVGEGEPTEGATCLTSNSSTANGRVMTLAYAGLVWLRARPGGRPMASGGCLRHRPIAHALRESPGTPPDRTRLGYGRGDIVEALGYVLLIAMAAVLVTAIANSVRRTSQRVQQFRGRSTIPGPGEVSSAAHLRNAELYADRIEPQAQARVDHFLGAVSNPDRLEWRSAGVDLYKRVVFRIPADNDWRSSVGHLAGEIVATVDRQYPDEGKVKSAAAFAAFLATVAGDALIYMLPSSGREAAGQLIARIGAQ